MRGHRFENESHAQMINLIFLLRRGDDSYIHEFMTTNWGRTRVQGIRRRFRNVAYYMRRSMERNHLKSFNTADSNFPWI